MGLGMEVLASPAHHIAASLCSSRGTAPGGLTVTKHEPPCLLPPAECTCVAARFPIGPAGRAPAPPAALSSRRRVKPVPQRMVA